MSDCKKDEFSENADATERAPFDICTATWWASPGFQPSTSEAQLQLAFWGQADTYLCAANWVQLRMVLPGTGVGVVSRWWGYMWDFLGGSVVRNPPANAGDAGLISGWGRSPGEGNDNPLQYSCLENPMERGAWKAAVHGVTESQTWLSDWPHKLELTCRTRLTEECWDTHPQLCLSRCWKDLIWYFVHHCLYVRVFNEKC